MFTDLAVYLRRANRRGGRSSFLLWSAQHLAEVSSKTGKRRRGHSLHGRGGGYLELAALPRVFAFVLWHQTAEVFLAEAATS